MKANQRRESIITILKDSDNVISASKLATMHNVSRQVIVGDIALLKASGHKINTTIRGYIIEKETITNRYIVACKHSDIDTKDELYTMIDLGAIVENVIVTHPVYGELIGNLHLKSRYDIDNFIDLCKSSNCSNLSELSNGEHLHTIICDNDEQFKIILNALKEKNYLLNMS